jgi:hypothetical protein
MDAPPFTPVGAEKTQVPPEESPRSSHSVDDAALAADALLLQQLRCGDAEAGRHFVHDYYPGIYRYLLCLTGRPEAAEDLTQAGEPRFGAAGDSGGGRTPGS